MVMPLRNVLPALADGVPTTLRHHELLVHDVEDPHRGAVEAFIRRIYARAIRRGGDALRADAGQPARPAWRASPPRATAAPARAGCSWSAICARRSSAAGRARRRAAGARAHRRSRPPCRRARRRRTATDPAARAAPRGTGLRMGGRHAHRRSCATCSCASASRRWSWARPIRPRWAEAAPLGQLLRAPAGGAGRAFAAGAAATARGRVHGRRGMTAADLRRALDDGERTWTPRRAADTTMLRLARATARRRRTRVLATLMDNSPAWVVADLAAARGRRRACAAAAVLHRRADRARAASGRRRHAARVRPRSPRAGPRRRCRLARWPARRSR